MKKHVLRNFTKFTGKQRSSVAQTCSVKKVFSCEFCEISKNTFFYRTPLVAASENTLCQSLFFNKVKGLRAINKHSRYTQKYEHYYIQVSIKYSHRENPQFSPESRK